MYIKTKNDLDSPHRKTIAEYGLSFLGLINKKGRVTSFATKEIKLETHKREMFFMSHALTQRLNDDFDDDFGPVEYSVTQRKAHKFITIPTSSGTLLAIMPKERHHETFIEILDGILTYSRTMQ